MSKPVIITCAPTGNPETGQPDPRPELFLDFMGKISAECDAVLNVSTAGGLGMTREERLRAAVATSPEMASLNVGSLVQMVFGVLGGNLRVGIEALGCEVATPAQARERLGLKGADLVTF